MTFYYFPEVYIHNVLFEVRVTVLIRHSLTQCLSAIKKLYKYTLKILEEKTKLQVKNFFKCAKAVFTSEVNTGVNFLVNINKK